MQYEYNDFADITEDVLVGIEDIAFYTPPFKTERLHVLSQSTTSPFSCLSPPWEDSATFAANAAIQIIKRATAQRITCVISYDATSLSPLSNTLQQILPLSPYCHYIDIKTKDFSLLDMLFLVKTWLQPPENNNDKVLILLPHYIVPHSGADLNKGNGAIALLMSSTPKILSIFPEFIPIDWKDPRQYACFLAKKLAHEPFDTNFQFSVYDLWDQKIIRSLHHAVLEKTYPHISKEEIQHCFHKMVSPSLRYFHENGDFGMANLYIGLLSLLDTIPLSKSATPVALQLLQGNVTHGLFYAEINHGASEHIRSYCMNEYFEKKKILSLREYGEFYSSVKEKNFTVTKHPWLKAYSSAYPYLILNQEVPNQYQWLNT